ncbi:hypothetical protein SAMN04490179_4225 [Pseudomonas antarctica]|uniref:Lipoprotein n=2 Tax=Pseudomonas antarctica TaxID=219572 RepID=A0A1H0BCD6_9PSED|nr:hypothetical protein PSAN_45680 [Pseudomonas antarctica]SDN43288.1 hypothetical protein SAMN04490179_4225 [Pseudomonas antarctica]
MRVTPVLLALALAGCSAKPPQLSESAQASLNAPMPTSEKQRVWECAGTSNVVEGHTFVLKLQGRPADSDGEIWATLERAKRLGCTQAEMDAPDMGHWSSPFVVPRPR